MSAFAASDIDAKVGARIQLRRVELNMSQADLANAIGVTFQQVQKYERGTNRVAASRLYQIACALRVGVAFFYQDLPAPDATVSESPTRKSSQRLKVEALLAGPVGGRISFSYGTFPNPSGLDGLCRRVGGSGWYAVHQTPRTQVATKIRDNSPTKTISKR